MLNQKPNIQTKMNLTTPEKSTDEGRVNLRSSTKKRREETESLISSNKKKAKTKNISPSVTTGSSNVNAALSDSNSCTTKETVTKLPSKNLADLLTQESVENTIFAHQESVADESYNGNTVTKNATAIEEVEPIVDDIISSMNETAVEESKRNSSEMNLLDQPIDKVSQNNSMTNSSSIDQSLLSSTNVVNVSHVDTSEQETPLIEEKGLSQSPKDIKDVTNEKKETPEDDPETVKDQINEQLLVKLNMKNLPYTSIVNIYSNQNQNVNMYVCVTNSPSKKDLPDTSKFFKFKMASNSSYDKKNFTNLSCNEVECIAAGLKNMELCNQIFFNYKSSSRDLLPPGDFMMFYYTSTLICIGAVDIGDIVDKKSIIPLDGYLKYLEDGITPIRLNPRKIKSDSHPEEKIFRENGYSLRYQDVAKSVSPSQIDLYKELDTHYKELIAQYCLPHYTSTEWTLSSAERVLVNMKPTWNAKFIRRTINTIHYHAVKESKKTVTGNQTPVSHFENHMMTLRRYKMEKVASKKVIKSVKATNSIQRQLAGLRKKEHLRTSIRPFNREDFQSEGYLDIKPISEAIDRHSQKTQSALDAITNRLNTINDYKQEIEELVAKRKEAENASAVASKEIELLHKEVEVLQKDIGSYEIKMKYMELLVEKVNLRCSQLEIENSLSKNRDSSIPKL